MNRSIPSSEASMEAARRESEILARLQKDLNNKRLAIIVGAGVTLSATADASGEPLSRISWTGLIQNGLDYLVSEGYVDRSNRSTKQACKALEDPGTDGLLHAANILSSQLEQHRQFPTWLQSVFGSLYQDVRHPAILETLKKLHENGAVLLTTNYDDVLETYCGIRHIGRTKIEDIMKFRRGDLDGVFHVHGSYHDPQEVVLDTTDYYQIRKSDEVQNMLKAFLDDKTVLFVGCGSGLEDPNFDELLKWYAERQKNIPNKHCLLVRDGDSLICKPLLRVKYGPNYHDLAPYLNKLLHDGQAARINTEETFSVNFSLSEVPETEHFVARQEELAKIHKILGGDGTRSTAVLHGLGGIGKTQLTVAYAKRHKADYSAIFWLNSKDENSLKQSLAKVAGRILQENPSASRLGAINKDSNLDEMADAVKRWLDHPKNTRWLMIYDNYDNPKLRGNTDPAAVDIRRFLPEADHGSIIITTRSSQVDIGRRIRVEKLENVHDSLEILGNTSRRENVTDDPAALELVKELDGLPLALATAGAYLDQVATSFADYLRLYKGSWLRLQQTSPELNSYEDRALYSTWTLSFDHIQRQNELSTKLLQLWAYFDNQDIWFELLRHGNSNSPEWFSQLTKDELSFTQAVRILCDYGLAEVDKSSESGIESRGYSMHSCVHSWTIHVLNQEREAGMAEIALDCVGSHVPNKAVRNYWVTQRRLIRHAARCWYLVINGLVKEDGIAWIINSLGNLYRNQGKLAEAEKIYERALQGKEEVLGEEDGVTLDTVNYLGILYSDQSKLGEAEKMYERALRGREKALGAEHISTLDTVHNLGVLYSDQGKLVEAEKMYERALQGCEKTLGAEHISTLNTVQNLGSLYSDQGKLDEAEKMYERALEGFEKTLGAEHISTLDTVHNLGVLYFKQRKLIEVEKMYERALQGCEKILGTEHISTLETVHNLGNLYFSQGKLVEAEKMYERALQGYEKALGREQVNTYIPALNTIQGLGMLYQRMGRADIAEDMYSRALSGFETVLGRSSQRFQKVAEGLARLRGDKDKNSC